MFTLSKKIIAVSVLGICSAVTSMHAYAAPMKLRLAHVFSADNPIHLASQQFADLLKEKSKGEIIVTIFPNGQLGGDEAIAREVSRGSLDLAFVNPGSLSGLDPLLDIHYLPYIVTNFEEADKIFYNKNGILQKTLKETLAKHKMEAIAFFELEFRGITNSTRAIEKPADIKGLKLRVPGSSGIRGFFEEAGAQAITMPMPELFTALQQKTVDGQDNGASITYNSRLFEAQKFMTPLNHVYAMGSAVASQRLWNRLNDQQKQWFREAAEQAAAEEVVSNRKQNAEFMKRIADSGVKITPLSPTGLLEFRKISERVWEKLEPVYGKERVDALRKEVAALRAK